jgi:hypothetical protein
VRSKSCFTFIVRPTSCDHSANQLAKKSENDFNTLRIALNGPGKPSTDIRECERMRQGHEIGWEGVSWPSACWCKLESQTCAELNFTLG